MLQPVRIKGPFRGLVTRKDAVLLADNEASDLSNVILSSNGIEARKGVAKFLSRTGTSVTTDVFTRPDSATVGNGWTESQTNGTWDIASNKLVWTNTTGANAKRGFCYKNTIGYGSFSAISQATLSSTGSGTIFGGLTLRQSGSSAMYGCALVGSSGGVTTTATTPLIFYYHSSHGFKVIAASEYTGSDYQLNSTPKTIRFMVIGNYIAFYLYINSAWKLLCSCNDDSLNGSASNLTTYTEFGFVGGNDGNASSTNNCLFDDFSIVPHEAYTSVTPFNYNHTVPGSVATYRKTLLKYANTFSMLDSIGADSAAAAPLTSGTIYPGTIPQTANVGNYRYFADGSPNFYFHDSYTSGTQVRPGYITAPSITPAVASGGAGNLTGTYDYKMTYYSSVYSIESVASTASATITLNGEDVDISGMTLSADTLVDKHRIYRRKVSAGETAWSLVAEISEATTYTDNIKDADLNYNQIAPTGTDLTYRNFTTLAYYLNRMFFSGGGTNSGSNLYYSALNNPFSIPANNYLSIGENARDNAIVGIVESFGVLVIFKKVGMFILTGSDIDSFDVSPLDQSVTCVSPNSIIKANGGLYWMGESAAYFWDGAGQPRIISDDISPTLNARIKNADTLISGVNDVRLGCIYWTSWGADSVAANKLLVYFYEHSKRIGSDSWAVWDLPVSSGGDGLSVVGQTVSTINGATEIWWGLWEKPVGTTTELNISDAHVGRYKHDGSTYTDSAQASADTDMPWYWTTGKIDAGAHDINKVWGEITVDAKKQGTTNTLTITPTRNDESADTALTGDMGTSGIIRGNLGKHSRHLKLKFSGSGQAATLYGYMLEVEPEGRA